MEITTRKYETVTHDLDGKNELMISTYPSEFPEETASIPFLYKALRTPERVNFQVFIRAKGKNGRNPHIEDIAIHSFSYAFPNPELEPVLLLEDYDSNFWMQGDPQNDELNAPPVLHSKGWYLNANIDMTVNGERYQLTKQMHAQESTRFRPLILYMLQ